VTNIYRQTAMDVAKQSHGGRKRNTAWSGQIGRVKTKYETPGKNSPFAILRDEISEPKM
jgi:hypothetical protein